MTERESLCACGHPVGEHTEYDDVPCDMCDPLWPGLTESDWADYAGALAGAVLELAAALADAERQRDEARDAAAFWKRGARAMRDQGRFAANSNAAIASERLTSLRAAEAALADTQEALRALIDWAVCADLQLHGEFGFGRYSEDSEIAAARAVLSDPSGDQST